MVTTQRIRWGRRSSKITKVLELLTDLKAKVVKEGEDAEKTYTEFTAWCEDRSKNLQYEVKTGKAEIANLEADIDHAAGAASAHEAKIEETSASVATNEADLKAATMIRKTEEADFAASEKELQFFFMRSYVPAIKCFSSAKHSCAPVHLEKPTWCVSEGLPMWLVSTRSE